MADLTTCEDISMKGSIGIASLGGTDSALYYTDSHQGIRERTYHNAACNGGNTAYVIFSGKNTTPLAVMQWFWDMSGTTPINSIRVYYLDNNCKIQEICWDGQISSWPQATPPANWFAGELNSNPCTTAGNSNLACNPCYAADPDGNLAQYKGDPGDFDYFTKQSYSSIITILEGSSLAAQVVKVNGVYKVRVFFIHSTNAISTSAATATSQGKKVLLGRNVPVFLNISQDYWKDDSDGGEAAVAEFD